MIFYWRSQRKNNTRYNVVIQVRCDLLFADLNMSGSFAIIDTDYPSTFINVRTMLCVDGSALHNKDIELVLSGEKKARKYYDITDLDRQGITSVPSGEEVLTDTHIFLGIP